MFEGSIYHFLSVLFPLIFTPVTCIKTPFILTLSCNGGCNGTPLPWRGKSSLIADLVHIVAVMAPPAQLVNSWRCVYL